MSTIYIRTYLDIINEANAKLDERANFREPDAQTEKAFDTLVQCLGIHDSGVTPLWRKLSTDGVFERQIDPRNPINKFTIQQWQRVQNAVAGYFKVEFADGILTISAA